MILGLGNKSALSVSAARESLAASLNALSLYFLYLVPFAKALWVLEIKDFSIDLFATIIKCPRVKLSSPSIWLRRAWISGSWLSCTVTWACCWPSSPDGTATQHQQHSEVRWCGHHLSSPTSCSDKSEVIVPSEPSQNQTELMGHPPMTLYLLQKVFNQALRVNFTTTGVLTLKIPCAFLVLSSFFPPFYSQLV